MAAAFRTRSLNPPGVEIARVENILDGLLDWPILLSVQGWLRLGCEMVAFLDHTPGSVLPPGALNGFGCFGFL